MGHVLFVKLCWEKISKGRLKKENKDPFTSAGKLYEVIV